MSSLLAVWACERDRNCFLHNNLCYRCWMGKCCLVLGWRQAETSSRSWGASLSKTEAIWWPPGNFVQNRIFSALHQSGLRKASVLGGKYKAAVEVNNFLLLERKSLVPATRALEQHRCAARDGTQVVVCSPAQRKLSQSRGPGGWWVAGVVPPARQMHSQDLPAC